MHSSTKLKPSPIHHRKMAISINFNCCLRPSPPSPPRISPALLSPTPRLTSKDSTGTGLRSRCVSLAAACLVIGCVDATNGTPVAAMEQFEHAAGPVTEREITRWSNKIRKCPPWRENALENVMPENLPRLTDRGRTDGFVSGRSAAPAIGGGAIRFNKSCYSL